MRSSKITMFMSEINYDIDYSIDLRLLGSINSGKIILTPKYPSAAISMRKLRILRININTSTELHPTMNASHTAALLTTAVIPITANNNVFKNKINARFLFTINILCHQYFYI